MIEATDSYERWVATLSKQERAALRRFWSGVARQFQAAVEAEEERAKRPRKTRTRHG